MCGFDQPPRPASISASESGSVTRFPTESFQCLALQSVCVCVCVCACFRVRASLCQNFWVAARSWFVVCAFVCGHVGVSASVSVVVSACLHVCLRVRVSVSIS